MFRGSMVALVTPLQDDTVDEARLRELVDIHISAGTHAIVVAGTTGESGTLTGEEKLRVIRTVVEQVNERVPVIAGISAIATKDCVALAKLVMECGVHAALVMTPAYIKPTQEGLFQHYRQIAANVPMPLIIYNVPGRTACDMLPETVCRLAQISNIVGIKEATGNMTRLQEILRLCGDSLDVFSGDDETAAQWLLAGAKGVISVTANVVPRMMAKMCDFALDEDRGACLRLNDQLMPLHKQLFVEANPIPVKWALSRLGLVNNELRLPLTPLSAEYHQAFEGVLKALELLV